MISFGP